MDRTPTALALKRIDRPLRLTWAGLWAERLTHAFWPLWTVLLAAFAALAFGVQDHLTLEAAWLAALAVPAAALWALVTGLRRFRRPTRDQALLRLDAQFPGRPIAALTDDLTLGAGDPATDALWAAHRARMAERAAAARMVQPDLKLSRRDPFALRYVALTAFVMALLFGSIWRAATLEGLVPGATAAVAGGPAWEGWIAPPAHTGKPTLYLADQTGDTLSVPAGSRVQVRLYGEPGALILTETVSGRTDPAPASEAAQDFVAVQSGTLAIAGDGGREWALTVVADAPPTIAPKGEIGREADGRFRQAFTASDDYGVTRGEVTIALDLAAVDRRFGLTPDPEAAPPVTLDLPLPVSRDRTEFEAELVDDLSQHLFANLPVTLTFRASDAAGQTGTAAPLSLTLPGRRFFEPLAAALIEMRRDLMWNRSNAPRVAQVLRAVTHLPEGFIRDEGAYLRLRVVIRQIEAEAATLSTTRRDEVVQELWDIALLVEEGDLASALERLRRAQDRLAEAIENGASPEEIDELMREMREAMDDYIAKLAEEGEPGENEQMSQGPGMEMSQDQLQQMLDELQRLMEEGRTAEAMELLQQLQQFMENMQVTEGQGQGQGQGGPGQQAMRDLGETLRDQQGLADEAWRDLQDGREGDDGLEPQDDGQQGQDGEAQDGEGQDGQGSLADRQRQLERQLKRLRRENQLPGGGGEAGEAGRQALEEAERAMREAERALREGDLDGALDNQADAMEAMREGLRSFGEALAEENRQRNGTATGDPDGFADNPEGRDPLGREPGDRARIGSDRNLLQGEDVYRRAQEILDEIRRRSGEQARPEGERDYLKRLLDLF